METEKRVGGRRRERRGERRKGRVDQRGRREAVEEVGGGRRRGMV